MKTVVLSERVHQMSFGHQQLVIFHVTTANDSMGDIW